MLLWQPCDSVTGNPSETFIMQYGNTYGFPNALECDSWIIHNTESFTSDELHNRVVPKKFNFEVYNII